MQHTVNPDAETAARFEHEEVDEKPIVMVNLLRFRDQADYAEAGMSARPSTGERAYERYYKAAVPLVLEVGGQVLWVGKVRGALIAPPDEHWDEVALVAYPSRAAFIRMVKSDAYQRIIGHRTAALEDSRLIETRPRFLPRPLLRLASLALRAKALVAPSVSR